MKVDNMIRQDIRMERTRQVQKWGVQRRSTFMWWLILIEEIGEFCKALLDTRQEFIQILAVITAWMDDSKE